MNESLLVQFSIQLPAGPHCTNSSRSLDHSRCTAREAVEAQRERVRSAQLGAVRRWVAVRRQQRPSNERSVLVCVWWRCYESVQRAECRGGGSGGAGMEASGPLQGERRRCVGCSSLLPLPALTRPRLCAVRCRIAAGCNECRAELS